ncbi:unnamed protein product [Allacma fusca]|uniref:Uncharacterized protein n=1 Tax=Allacma fusca TaxID=39272 RepID=A0A8J2JRT0_9HEXA|nr:unnamed protein product [Allacma fusca]
MAPKCPNIPLASTVAEDQQESIFVRLMFEVLGTLIIIIAIRLLRYLTNKAAPNSRLEHWLANIDFSPSHFISNRLVNTLAMPEENNFWGVPPEFQPQPQGVMSTAKSILPINNNDDGLQEIFLEFGGRGSKEGEKKVKAEENIDVWEIHWESRTDGKLTHDGGAEVDAKIK